MVPANEKYLDLCVKRAKEPAPEAELELLACNCKRSCNSAQSCSCVANGLKCTDICALLNCENQVKLMTKLKWVVRTLMMTPRNGNSLE